MGFKMLISISCQLIHYWQSSCRAIYFSVVTYSQELQEDANVATTSMGMSLFKLSVPQLTKKKHCGSGDITRRKLERPIQENGSKSR